MTLSPSHPIPLSRARGALFLVLVGGTTLGGSGLMLLTLAGGGLTGLEGAILLLFLPTFGWISIPFWMAVAGSLLRVLGRDPLSLAARKQTAPGPTAPLRSRTALLSPIRSEDADAVTARLSRMARSLRRSGQGAHFDFHILSDTTDPEVRRAEERAWALLQGEHPEARIHYRNRAHPTGRKAGNIAEFLERAGDLYDFFVVLDADSLMSGETLIHLARTLEAHPELGLIQTVPLPRGGRTPFARAIRFAARLQAPVMATGAAFFQGDVGNYWGHNAILRLRPFREHARLPILSGAPPFGGEILSHDFVEAALLRRAGWGVVLDPFAGGSWEEVPSDLAEYGMRDRRWAQGSLQHLRLLGTPGFHLRSRLHLLLGATGYLASLSWFLLLVAGTIWVLVPSTAAGGWTIPLPGAPSFPLLPLTAGVLLAPRLLGFLVGLPAEARGTLKRRGKRILRFLGATLSEALLSLLLAPILMLRQSGALLSILSGGAVGWEPARRRGRIGSWKDALHLGAIPTVAGIAWGLLVAAIEPAFLPWLLPILPGLLLSIPLARWTARARPLGRRVQDPPRHSGVLPPESGHSAAGSIARGTPMHHAERALFELRRGRPVLIGPRDSAGNPTGEGAVLALAAEQVDASGLARLGALSEGPLRLVVTAHRASSLGILPQDSIGTAFVLGLSPEPTPEEIRDRARGTGPLSPEATGGFRPATLAERAALALARLGGILPAVVTGSTGPGGGGSTPWSAALSSGALLAAEAEEVLRFVDAAERSVVRISEAPVPLPQTEDSRFVLYREEFGLSEHVAILVGRREAWPDPVPVRMHSACLTGDIFGSLRCDCGEQLRGSLDVFAARGGGVLLYLPQEGRGIGLGNKLRAYTLQGEGRDTIDADAALGFGADERDYTIAARILTDLGISRVELLTNNPEKVSALEDAGIRVVLRQPLHGRLNRHNLPYVRAKVQRAGHWLGAMLSQPIQGGD